MFKKSTIALLMAFSVASCGGSPDAKLQSGCMNLAKTNEDFDKKDQKEFCSCLGDQTESLDKKDKKTLGKIMKSYKDDENFQKILDDAIDDGDLSREGAMKFFSGLKTCSMNVSL